MRNITLIGAGTDLGVNIDGTRFGPKEVLKNSKDNKILLEMSSNIKKSNDIKDLKKNLQEINIFNEKLYHTILSDNNFCLTIGGDHSISIASGLASLKKHPSLGLIWIDAHLDYNTFDTTITGNLHGLPLATLNGLNKELRPFHNNFFYNPHNTVIIGYRAIEANFRLEMSNIKKMGVTVFTTEDIKNLGVTKVMASALKIANRNTSGIHISFDLDVIDPEIAKGVTVKEKDGLNLQEVDEITEIISKQSNIKSFDIVEYNPLKDTDNNTLKIINHLITKIKSSDFLN